MDEREIERAARSVDRVLDGFLAGVAERTTASEFEQVLFGRRKPGRVDLDYKPETYTRFNLVEPLVQAVGCDYQLEPRSTGIERDQWPDSRLTNTVFRTSGR